MQVRRSSNLPHLSNPLSAHLGLQRLRLQSPTQNGGCASRFSTAAEAASMAISAEAEANSSDHVEMEKAPTDDPVTASASAMPLIFEGEEGENALLKIVEEHRQLVSTLRAELEEHKSLTRCVLEEIRFLKSKADAKSAEITSSEKKRPWLEWTSFMEHLQDSGYFEHERRATASNGGSNFEDFTCVKRAICKFSQAHDSIFESLSQIDLRILAKYGCATNDSNAAASQKRLRQHFHLEDTSYDDVDEKSVNTQPKLSDVTRLLHTTIVEGTAEEDVRSSISHLLREIITLSRKSRELSSPTDEVKPRASPSPSPPSLDIIENLEPDKVTESSKPGKVLESSKPDKEKILKEKKMDAQKVIAAIKEGSLRTETQLETTARSSPQWKCPRCSFMNLDTKYRCVECSRRRPQSTYAADAAKNSDDTALVREDSEQAKKANERENSMLSSPVQGRKSSEGRSSSLASEEELNTDLEHSSSDDGDKNEAKDPFEVLDDILDSNDFDEDKVSKEEPRGNGKKATSLSGLFTKPSKRNLERRDDVKRSGRRPFKNNRHEEGEDQGRSKHSSIGADDDEDSLSDAEQPLRKGFDSRDGEQRNNVGRSRRSPFKSKRYEDDNDFRRSRHVSLGADEDEDSLSDGEPSSRKGVDDEEGFSHRSGRDGYNGSRGRGGGRGYRGDSYDDRRNGGFRGGREFGDRDRGSRSDSYGSRAPRGRSRY